MSCIKRLPAHIANQIAAGEVVERPVSVVKELVENSIDAGARSIDICLKDGGKSLVEVRDDGAGMSKQDLALCIEPHATSKIETQEDLFAIKTLGFRGEALASIASVSRLSITSRQEGADSGWKITVNFGRVSGMEPAACSKGTIVRVKDLFAQVPARAKFLKGSRSEYARCLKVIHLFCVAWPEIGFSLKNGRKLVFRKRAGDGLKGRLELLLGRQCLSALREIEGEGKGIRLRGNVADPGEIRVSSRHFYFFLNRRPITSPILWKALNEAMKGFIVKGNYPVGVLFIDVDPSLVDMNVHPSKNEVRFESPESVFRLVYHGVRRGLEETGRMVSVSGYSVSGETTGSDKDDFKVSEQIPLPWEDTGKRSSEREIQACSHYYPPPLPMDEIVEDPAIKQSEERPTAQLSFEIIGQFASSYILFEKDGQLFILDQHAGHEAVIFKRLMNEMDGAGRLPGQRLLFPVIMDLSPGQLSKVMEHASLLEGIGMEIEEFGHDQLKVSSLPGSFLGEGNDRQIVSDIIGIVLSGELSDRKRLFHEIFAKMACGLAIKANQRLDRSQMMALVEEILDTGVTNCPHGRPVIKAFTLGEIERKFFRK